MDKLTRRYVIQRLKRGIARIEAGWCQGQMENRLGDVCALGAINNNDLSTHIFNAARVELIRSLPAGSKGSQTEWALTSYNDKPQRTKRQIIRLFERTIARLEKEAGA